MAIAEKEWQTQRPTIRERTKFMLNNDLFSDVKFVAVRKSDSELERKGVIPAHKFVLSIGSPVFEAMFCGELAETRDSIELPDCDYNSLLELFRYMYSDEVNLSGSTVMGVLYLAKKYMVPSLAEKCTKYLQDHLDASNVFSILPFAQRYEEKNLMDRCWKVIDKRTEEAMKSDEFVKIERSLLEEIIARNTLNIEEIELFKAIDRWATKECQRQGLTAGGKMKRMIIGEQIVKEIRFPTMELEDIAGVVLCSEILTTEEFCSVEEYFRSASSLNTPVGFSGTKRSGCGGKMLRCCRFSSLNGYRYVFPIDVINVSVDRDVSLHGLCLFGSEDYSFSLDLEIQETISKSVLASKRDQFSSELLHSSLGNYCGFEVLLDIPVGFKKNNIYCIKAKITGPCSVYGSLGVSSVSCSGVSFTFFNSGYPESASSVTFGQFPELLFSV